MIDQPAGPVIEAPSSDRGPIELHNVFWPWLDLDAQNLPADVLTTDLRVQLALSMLVGMQGNVPHIIQTDDVGNLTINTRPNSFQSGSYETRPAEDYDDDLRELPIDVALAAGATQTFNAIVGHYWVLYEFAFSIDVVPAAISDVDLMNGTATTTYARGSSGTTAQQRFQLLGRRTPINGGVAIKNYSTSAIVVRGHLNYADRAGPFLRKPIH